MKDIECILIIVFYLVEGTRQTFYITILSDSIMDMQGRMLLNESCLLYKDLPFILKMFVVCQSMITFAFVWSAVSRKSVKEKEREEKFDEGGSLFRMSIVQMLSNLFHTPKAISSSKENFISGSVSIGFFDSGGGEGVDAQNVRKT